MSNHARPAEPLNSSLQAMTTAGASYLLEEEGGRRGGKKRGRGKGEDEGEGEEEEGEEEEDKRG